MTKRLALSAIGVIVLIALAAGQTPREPGIVRGRIATADTAKPLRRARVSLIPLVQQVGQIRMTVSTNALGQYELRDVPAGSYRVSAARDGYVTLEHGQRRPFEDGQTIVVRGARLSIESISRCLAAVCSPAGLPMNWARPFRVSESRRNIFATTAAVECFSRPAPHSPTTSGSFASAALSRAPTI
jgi:hypothetical protein